jgi:hypothetical protein
MAAGNGVANHVHGGNDANPLIVTVFFKQFLREGEKTGIDEAVVFQNDSFLFMFEKPRDGGSRATAATEILFIQVGV